MAFGSTKARHAEVAASHLDMARWAAGEMRKFKSVGKCRMAIDYAFSVIESVSRHESHVIAMGISSGAEKRMFAESRPMRDEAKAVVKSCTKV